MAKQSKLIQVAVPVPLVGELDYCWTKSDQEPPSIGCRVVVPLGKTTKIGVVTRHINKSNLEAKQIKSVQEVLDIKPVLNKELLNLLRWCAVYYHHPIGEVLNHALPTHLRKGRPAKYSEAFWKLTKKGIALSSKDRLGKFQTQALSLLRNADLLSSKEFLAVGIKSSVLKRMNERGWIQHSESYPDIKTENPIKHCLPELTNEQNYCISSVEKTAEDYAAYLLQGVTGSGKTEVYMRLISKQIQRKKQSLLLVPEIGLTPQLIKRLKQRFRSCLAIMHSGLTANERLNAWNDARSGKAKVIVGTRSAIFAPLSEAGLIIVDEEHDSSYKQQDGFKYSARDLAVLRAQRLKIPIVLASATPSLESVYNIKRGRYKPLKMSRRIGSAGKPNIHLINMNLHANRRGLSTPLIAAIERNLLAHQQILLFLNRRGFAPVLLCIECGSVEECNRCDARMTLHAKIGQLRCHHCGLTRGLKWRCSSCASERIAVGSGTQRVTDELQSLFPEARIARLDRDTANSKNRLEAILSDIEQGDVDIVVGTQMLSKGHDFPKVTLVGVLNADQGLFGTDFRSSEKLAQMLIQVAGRAGRRDKPGEVFVQSHYPNHPLLKSLSTQDYDSFIELALAERKLSSWPPFSHLIVWRAEATNRKVSQAFLERVAVTARKMNGNTLILGPAAANMEKRGNRFRAHLLFQDTTRADLHKLTRKILPLVRMWPEARRVRWSIDVDPIEL